jgi:large subunit ribosomal protein L4
MSPQAKTAPGTAKAPKLGAQGSVDLPAEVFGERFHDALVYEAARAEQLALRRGTAATKTRGEVRGGGTKPWRQKGTGRARTGSIRSPQWTGGGTTFGPEPRGYTVKVNRKARRRALRAALSMHAERGSVAVVDASSFNEPSTRQAAESLESLEPAGPVLVLLGEEEDTCARSFRNIDRVRVLPAQDAGVADVMGAASVVLSDAGIESLSRVAKDGKEGGSR